MRRLGRKKVRASRKKLFFTIFTTVFLTTLLFFSLNSNFFSIKIIEIKAENINCTDSEQIKNSGGLIGKNLIFLNTENIVNNLIRQFLCIKEVKISKHLPNKVSFFVKGREAVAVLSESKEKVATSSSLESLATPSAQISEVHLIDQEAIIFHRTENQNNLPIIFTSNLNTPYLKDSLKIVEKVKTFGVDIGISELKENLLIIYSSPRIIFKLGEKIDNQTASLQLILNKAKIDNDRLEFIDLRFDKPLIKIAPKKK